MTISQNNGNVIITDVKNFALHETLDCGQAFRWYETETGCWQGIAFGKFLKLSIKDNVLTLYNTSLSDYNEIWSRYFDLERDYEVFINACKENELLSLAADYGSGIRILNQEPWEALCSFIISQNNNIPRIKGIIERLCEQFGKETEGGFTFPSADVIATKQLEDLAPLRSGFRAKYILDAAQKVSDGKIVLDKLRTMDYEQAREKLMEIKGVGGKVADCTLLFGLGKIEAFPKDVWIKRVMETHFPDGLPESTLSFAGIIQQYLFFYARSGKL